MNDPYKSQSKKRAVNVTLDAALVAEAKAMKVGLSALFETALRDHIKERRAQQWLSENQDAIDCYNRRVERDGVFSDGRRRF